MYTVTLLLVLSIEYMYSATKGVDTQGQPPALVGGLPVGGGITPQPAFCYRGVWIPLIINITAPQGSHKPLL